MDTSMQSQQNQTPNWRGLVLQWLQIAAPLTLPPGLADGFDLDVHGHALCRPLLATVKGGNHDLVVLLVVIAEPLRVTNVT